MDVFHQRLEQEHGESVILTAPTVPYTLQLADGREERIQNPSKYPVDQKVCLSVPMFGRQKSWYHNPDSLLTTLTLTLTLTQVLP